MVMRTYLLLDVLGGTADQVVQNLLGKPGVAFVDRLDGPPDVIMMIQAENRLKLAEVANQALGVIESMAKGIRVLPARDVVKR